MEKYFTEVSQGSVFDPVFDALGKTIQVYGQVQNVKLQSQLAKAQASAMYAGAASYPQDAQAISQNTQATGNTNMLLVGLAVLAGAAALYVIVK